MIWKTIGQRIVSSLPTLLGVSILAFSLIHLAPGDPVKLLLGERGASPEAIAKMQAHLGLDKPLIVQYLTYLKNIFRGDFGVSIVSSRPVLEEFFDRFPATIELGLVAVLLAVFLGVPMGILAAAYRNSKWDNLLMGTALVGYSMPLFWWGMILIMYFSVHWGLTPVSGRLGVEFEVRRITGFLLVDSWFSETPWETFKSAFNHLLLPALALSSIPLGAVARMSRSSLLETMGEDFIRTAWAKGLTPRVVWMHHGLKNALLPIITVIGLMVGSVLTGAVLTETLFAWPGIGRWLVMSVESRDYPVIQGGIFFVACVVIGVNLVVDLLYLAANPLLRRST